MQTERLYIHSAHLGVAIVRNTTIFVFPVHFYRHLCQVRPVSSMVHIPRDLITKTSCDLSCAYLKLDHMSIVRSRITGKVQCNLFYDYRNIITEGDVRTS